MPHPHTSRLAAAMYAADGNPTRDARGNDVDIDTYRAWAESALTALAELAPGLNYALVTMYGQPPILEPDTVAELHDRLHRAMHPDRGQDPTRNAARRNGVDVCPCGCKFGVTTGASTAAAPCR